jgi:signal transduction histidine kinase/CheY-like chemotaxis protein
MATILVVDDEPVNRQLLNTVLGYRGHRLLEAGDGPEGLAQVRAERPELVITDILMPTMDGYEFVHRLRSDDEAFHTPVIFYAAAYHESEARQLAEDCGVSQLIFKPSEPEAILSAVDAALNATCLPPRPLSAAEFDHEHSQLLTDKLSQKVKDQEAANLRLSKLREVGRLLATEQDRLRLLRYLCASARDIIGARYAAVGFFEPGEPALRPFFISGVDAEPEDLLGCLSGNRGLLARLLTEALPMRVRDIGADALAAGFPPAHLATRSFLGIRMGISPHAGVLYLMEKLGAEEFSEQDEQVVVTLAAQAAVAHENTRRYEEIQRHAAELEREVMERKRAEEEVRSLNAELERQFAELTTAHQDLETFSYSVSHDLRAPLRHIHGFSKILSEQAGSSLAPDARQCLQRICEGSVQMGTMIDELLCLGQTGRREVNRQPAELDSLVREALNDLAPEMEGREVEWKIAPLPVVDCDSFLTKMVLANLLSNAVKFTRPRKPAVIQIGQMGEGNQPVIFVRDNGVGFNMKYADKLFGVFQRLHRKEDFDGTGIGLATVQRIIHKHGGRIWAEAEPDLGATFYFTLQPSLTGPE